MISALILNVKSATERREFQLQQLKALGIQADVLNATTLSRSQAIAYSHGMRLWERPIMNTEVAALDSHKRAWAKVAELDRPLLILEDDAILAPQTTEALKLLEPHLQDKLLECLTLEVRSRKKWLGLKPVLQLDLSTTENLEIYLLTPQGAKKLLDHNNNCLGLADALVWTTYELNSAQVVPGLAAQADQAWSYGFNCPINASSLINEGQKRQKSSLPFKLRRSLGQIKLALRLIRFAFRSKRVYVPLIKF